MLRKPGSVAEHGPRPQATVDYRFTLANERTFLAWIRTALAFLAGGVAVLHLLPAQPQRVDWGLVISLPLFVLAFVIAVASLHRWRNNNCAIERGEKLPAPGMVLVLVTVVSVMGIGGILTFVAQVG